ncbi:MAG: mandelate racemase/muconate lactonizing enzyme family protein [Gaiellaceae bacterium]
MRITGVRTTVVGTAWRNLVYVEIETDDGIVGLGEATLHNFEEAVLAHVDSLARRYVVGRDPFDVEDLVATVFRDEFFRGGGVHMTALAGIEIACWDLIGKATRQPVYRLLGGACHERVPAYANGWYTGERTPDEFAARAAAAVARGYRALKVDPFGAGGLRLSRAELAAARALVTAVRDAVGPQVELLLEGHGRFNASTAIEVARALADLDLGWFEEPVQPEDLAGLRAVAAAAPIPLAAGERVYTRYDAQRLLETGAVAVFQADPLHTGGLLETKKMIALAELYSAQVALHNSNGPVCSAVALHLHASSPNVRLQESFDDFAEPYVRGSVPGAPAIGPDGSFGLPTSPGLGVELDHALAAAHPYRALHFNLWAEDWHRRDV